MNHRLLNPLTLAIAALLLAGCKTAPVKDVDSKDPIKQTQGPIRVPSGIDAARLVKLEKGEMPRVFLQLLRIDDNPQNRLLFPRQMAASMDMTPSQLTRLFTDTILKSRRFEVFDVRSSVTAETSDYVIDSQIVAATQEIKNIEGGLRVVETRINLSVQMKNVYTGDFVFPTAVAVEGITGVTSGDRAVLQPRDTTAMPEVQQRMANDYLRALKRAYALAATRIEEVMRPVGKVMSADARAATVLGGQKQGFVGNDRMVVFRAQLTRVGKYEVFSSIKPIAVVQCDGVGLLQSQCDVIRLEAGQQVQPGDYTVLTDDSMKKDRFL